MIKNNKTARKAQSEFSAKMKLRSSALVVIICSILVQLANIPYYSFLLHAAKYGPISRTILNSLQGSMYLLFPLLGHLADVYLTRSCAMKCGLMILTGSMLYLTVFILSETIALNVFNTLLRFDLVIQIGGIGLTIIGLGLFEANIIQFGLDQLLEAPTPKLIAFIHWYYWAQRGGQLIIVYLVTTVATVASKLGNSNRLYSLLMTILLSLITITISVALVLYSLTKKHFYIQRAGINPFKTVYKVLKYSWKHKVPERRSAFTYWEEDIPRRIDLGKNKYGGPFTNEEVEDTKTFLRILPLLLCLFGYHLAGDGYSAPIQLQRTSCPSLPVLLLIVYNPQHIPIQVALVGIPLYRLVMVRIIQKINSTQMLTKMWTGLYFSLLQIVVQIVIVVTYDFCIEQSNTQSNIFFRDNRMCFNISITDQTANSQVDNTYLWFIIPQLLNGLSSLLVSMTVFEFICAQAPRTTQGLFIGLWYATFSIRYLVVGILDNLIIERRSWLICEGVKGFLILVSLVLFSCVSRRYHYRQRDEIVNVQGMIEDVHERWLDQEEEYMQERRAFCQKYYT